jgi:homoserine kinase
MAASPWIEAYAPATVSNLGPGFDCLGLALREPGDRVRARRRDEPGVAMLKIEGDDGKLPLDADRNTAAVAVKQILDRYAPKAGIELELEKGLPLGSGLGSSGASACAAIVAADAALGLGLGPHQMIEAAREGERVACGAAHPDNVAPALMGGIVLISSLDPLRVVSLPVPEKLWISVYTPGHPVSTADARAVLPKHVTLAETVKQSARLGLLVHALHEGDLQLLGEAIVDDIVEPARAHLIPGYVDAKASCVEAGAIACSISGAGPTTFALSDDEARARALLEILEETYTLAGVPGRGHVDRVGPAARVVSEPLH